MMEVYVLVTKRPSLWMIALNSLVIMLAVVTLFLSFTMPFVIVLAVGFGGLEYFVFMQTRLEYEYSYFDGEVRFAKVMNKSGRKSLRSYPMEEVLAIAPANDPAVQRYERAKCKVVDYTSGIPDTPYYEMAVRDPKQGNILIRFEPDEKYLNAVSQKFAQKIVRKKTDGTT